MMLGSGAWRSLVAHPALVREGRPATPYSWIWVGARTIVYSGRGAAW